MNYLIFLPLMGIALFIITVVPPFVLAVLGFRGSTHTALIGMGVGTLADFAWKKWITSTIGIEIMGLFL